MSAAPTLQNLKIGLKQKQGAREAATKLAKSVSKLKGNTAWRMAESILKLKEEHGAAFFSPFGKYWHACIKS